MEIALDAAERRIRFLEADIEAAHAALDKKPVPRMMTLGTPASLEFRISEYTLGWPLQHETRGERDRYRYALQQIEAFTRHRLEVAEGVTVAEIAEIARTALNRPLVAASDSAHKGN